MIPPRTNGLGTVEFFTNTGDGIEDVKMRISMDISNNLPKEVREHIANLQFGVFYNFMHYEHDLANEGRIFRAGLDYANKSNGGGPRRAPTPTPDPVPVTDDKKKVRKDA